MTTRRRWTLRISAIVAGTGLVLAATGHLRLSALLDVAHFGPNGALQESAAWQNDLLTQGVLVAAGAAMVLLGALGLMVAVSWKLRFPEALLVGAVFYFVIGDGARAFAHQLLGGFGGTSDVTFTIAPLLFWVGLGGFITAAVVLVGGIVGAVRALSPGPATAPAPPPI